MATPPPNPFMVAFQGWTPPQLQQPYGLSFQQTVAGLMQQLSFKAKQAVQMSYPTQALTFGASDALTTIGSELSLPRARTGEQADSGGPGDTSYAAYLLNAYTTWARAGTFNGIFEALVRAGWGSESVYQGSTNPTFTGIEVYRNRDFIYWSTNQTTGHGSATINLSGNAARTHDLYFYTQAAATPSRMGVYVDNASVPVAWNSTTTYVAGAALYDSNDFFWVCIGGGTSGNTTPAWPDPPAYGQTFEDGSVTWQCVTTAIPATLFTLNLPDGLLTATFAGTFGGGAVYHSNWTPTPPDTNQSLWGRYWLALSLPGPVGTITTPTYGPDDWTAGTTYSAGDYVVGNFDSNGVATNVYRRAAGGSHVASLPSPAGNSTFTDGGGNVWQYTYPAPSPDFYYGQLGASWGGLDSGQALSDAMTAIVAILNLWEGAHSQCIGVWLVPAGVSLNIVQPTNGSVWNEDGAQFYNSGTSGASTAALWCRLNGWAPLAT